MSKIKTLNEIEHLKSSGYGRPWPRHGLHLLYWFSNEYVTFDNNGDLVVLEHPKNKTYGFHWFHNHVEDDGIQLLPQQNTPYYEVGNLFSQGADDLPEYVSSNLRKYNNFSNMDRLIINLHRQLKVDKVYVTQHMDKSSFDRENTFCISKGLVRNLRNLDLEDGLLRQVGYVSQTASSQMVVLTLPSWQEDLPPDQLTSSLLSGQGRDVRSWSFEGNREDWRQDDVVISMPYNASRRKTCCNCVIL